LQARDEGFQQAGFANARLARYQYHLPMPRAGLLVRFLQLAQRMLAPDQGQVYVGQGKLRRFLSRAGQRGCVTSQGRLESCLSFWEGTDPQFTLQDGDTVLELAHSRTAIAHRGIEFD